ncbi:MAG TPA: hypothetical protein PKZ92_03345 [Candidatus Woesebacteria bacterium]|jgi:hypothetical protein|nr:hypothetical protein [Candidatus Shapirobacteria bacterium]HOR02265.1 hypothetical protein [Candidatus Woesebacteria bacterium]
MIKISKIFWSIPDTKFSDNILSKVLGIKKLEDKSPKFQIYILPNKTEIIAIKETKTKIYDSSLHFYLPSFKINQIKSKFDKLGYSCHLAKSGKTITLSCFAPSPHSWCEIHFSNYSH